MKGLAKTAFLALLLGSTLSGCGRTAAPSASDELTQAAALTHLRSAATPALRAEIARLDGERMLPAQLTPPLDPRQTEWLGLVSPSAWRSLAERKRQWRPLTRPVLARGDLAPLRALAAEFDPQRKTMRRLVAGESPLVLSLPLVQGMAIDLTLCDAAAASHLWEWGDVCLALADGDPREAVESIRVQLRIARALADLPHPTARLLAADLRRETLLALQAVLDLPACTRQYVAELSEQLEETLAHWPRDARAWEGDRAIALVTYELAASGHVGALLGRQELLDLDRQGRLREWSDAIREHWEDDALAYLKAIRTIIAACDLPYRDRREAFASWNELLRQTKNTSAYPHLAATLLLPNLEKGHAAQALDRARCEACRLALSLAATDDPPATVDTGLADGSGATGASAPGRRRGALNGLTGQPLVVRINAAVVEVSGIAPGPSDEPVCVRRIPRTSLARTPASNGQQK